MRSKFAAIQQNLTHAGCLTVLLQLWSATIFRLSFSVLARVSWAAAGSGRYGHSRPSVMPSRRHSNDEGAWHPHDFLKPLEPSLVSLQLEQRHPTGDHLSPPSATFSIRLWLCCYLHHSHSCYRFSRVSGITHRDGLGHRLIY